MKLKNGFITHQIDDEQIMVGTGNVGFSGLVRSNKTAALIVDCLKQETTKEKIVDVLAAKYDADRAVLDRDVEKILNILRKVGALDE